MKLLSFFHAIQNIFFQVVGSQEPIYGAKGGRPRGPFQRYFKAIFFMLIRGWTWRDIPRWYGARSTIFDYFSRWARSGPFLKIWHLAIEQLTEIHGLDFELLYVDGSNKPVKNMPKEFTGVGHKHKNKNAIKITLIITAEGIPVGLHIGSATDHDTKHLQPAVQNLLVEPSEDGVVRLIGDKGYVGQPSQEVAKEADLEMITPIKSNEVNRKPHAKEIQNQIDNRSLIERMFARLYQFRRLNVVFDKKIKHYTAWCHLALGVLALSFIK